ncbi:MAG: hypothetical protein KF709_05310 [Gemmatimonadaceae bacterium]|nr:hypothetical protein [Gemmatimonadaceae bacterium]
MESCDSALRTLAFPRNLASARAAMQRLEELRVAAHTLPALERHRGDDSGLEGTTSRHCFDLGLASWLVARFPHDAEVDWSASGAAEAAAELARPSVTRLEEEGFDSDTLTMHRWILRARGHAWPSDLAWLLDALADTGDSLPRRAAAWEAAALPIKWQLRQSGVLNAHIRGTRPRVRQHLRPPPHDTARFVASAPPPSQRPRRLTLREAVEIIDLARATLAARCREVHALSYANPHELWWSDLGAGTALAVIGVIPAMRLPLEGNYAFVLFANGVPVGYGGVSPLAAQANTGLNIFPAFRGTEASALWARTLRCFHALFGVRRFIVNPFQVGEGNPEALASGAFWFYHRLGFRPVDAMTRGLAERLAASPRRAASRETQRLATADLALRLPGWHKRDAFDERWLATLSLQASSRIAREGHVDRHEAVGHIVRRLRRQLQLPAAAPKSEAASALQDLAPLADALLALDDRASVRQALRGWIRAKAAPQERAAVTAIRTLLPLLRRLATSSPASDPPA